MKILHVSFTDANTGSGIGAWRLHTSMLSYGLDSRLLVIHKCHDNETVITMPKDPKKRQEIHNKNRSIKKSLDLDNRGLLSFNIFNSGMGEYINNMEIDLVQMHWINLDTISISEIGSLNKPVYWKLPDMWAFSGAEHYITPYMNKRYKEGYKRKNRNEIDYGFDINKWIWRYKRLCWFRKKINIIGPSKWMADCARESVLFRNNNITNIANPLDIDLYSPGSGGRYRNILNIDKDTKVVMFASLNATSDQRKGFQHLINSLYNLGRMELQYKICFVVIGSEGKDEKYSGITLKYLGKVTNENDLVSAYNMADVFVLPSKIDNLPNTIKEATCCGVPCVAFDVGGIPDMIEHKKNGYLAKPYDEMDLALGIKWVVENSGNVMSGYVRNKAGKLHEPSSAIKKYLEFYKNTSE